jgi:two-component system response regulator TctD
MAHILVVEDDPALARGVVALLRADGHAADAVSEGRSALLLAETEPCGLYIVDIGLPDVSGFDVIRRLRGRGDRTPILVLTAHDRVSELVEGLDLGADDYLVKPFDPNELSARIRALLRRNHGDPNPVQNIGRLAIDHARKTAEVAGRPLQLRPREWAVLACLSVHVGEVVPKNKLLAEVFSFDDEVGPNAVEVHVARVRRQLEPDGPTIRTLRGLGYVLDPG